MVRVGLAPTHDKAYKSTCSIRKKKKGKKNVQSSLLQKKISRELFFLNR